MRITVDIDGATVYKIRHGWMVLSLVCENVRGRVSASGNGVHLLGDASPEYYITYNEALIIREAAGDDSARLEIDKLYDGKPRQILFSSKGGLSAGEWVFNLSKLLGAFS
jgi:hypothetical protein